MNVHPAASIFPRMGARDLRGLRDDIKAHGLREPIWTYEKQILDGRHRWEVCKELGIKPQVREYDGDDPVGFVVSLNLNRRHLSDGQRSMVAAKIANLATGQRADHVQGVPIGLASEMLNVSERSVKRAKQVQQNGTPRLIEAVEKGEMSVSAAADVAKLPKSKQAKAMAEPKKKKAKPAQTDDWKTKYDALAADYDELKENRDELADELKTCEAIRTSSLALEMKQLREHLKICTRRRDELMANAVEMRKSLQWWQAQAKKLGYKPK